MSQGVPQRGGDPILGRWGRWKLSECACVDDGRRPVGSRRWSASLMVESDGIWVVGKR
jgi:hypothetical protein